MDSSKLEPFLTRDTRNAMAVHMLETPEVEVCGLITLSKGEYEYHRLENVHPEPKDSFRLSKKDSARIAADPDVVAYCHSHPNGPVYPSQHDVEVQAKIMKPAAMCVRDPSMGAIEVFSFGDHLLDAELMDRDFRFNVFDCLAALRSHAWQTEKRYMPPKPYEAGWWEVGLEDPTEIPKNENLYERCFQDYGYRDFTPDFSNPADEWHPRIGDVLMLQMGAPVINHVGVYVGDNLVYHHRVNKKSGTTPVGYLLGGNVIRKWVRYNEAHDEYR